MQTILPPPPPPPPPFPCGPDAGAPPGLLGGADGSSLPPPPGGPLIPVGAELLYQSTSLNLTDDAKQSEILNEEFGLFDCKSISTISLVATYSF